jgi:hypothetical protein
VVPSQLAMRTVLATHAPLVPHERLVAITGTTCVSPQIVQDVAEALAVSVNE